MKVLLASQSPRRKEILSFFKIPFEQVKPDFDEESIPFKGDPVAYAMEIALGKARSLPPSDSLILCADTVVYCNGKVYGKPQNLQENYNFLNDLGGKWHTVITAVCGKRGDQEKVLHEETKVLFDDLTSHKIAHYCRALEPQDKAGGYAIQGSGGIIVRRIEGCYYNAMGLPLNCLKTVLQSFGVDLWEHLH
jgi:septum formation protein